jgi:prepilin-type N-terminal cleavage/methylation domain-containing protein
MPRVAPRRFERPVLRHRYRRSSGGPGFTLIELLIVIVILGILAGIVVFAIGSTRDDAVASASAADKHQIVTAEEAYATQHGGTYTDQPTLVSDQYLHQVSQYWTVSVAAGGSSYTISPAPASGGGGSGSSGGACLTGQSLSPSAVRRQANGPPGPLAGPVVIAATINSGCASTVTAKFTPSSGTQTVTLTGSGTSWSKTIGPTDYTWAPGSYPITISAGSDSGTVTLTVCSAPQANCP